MCVVRERVGATENTAQLLIEGEEKSEEHGPKVGLGTRAKLAFVSRFPQNRSDAASLRGVSIRFASAPSVSRWPAGGALSEGIRAAGDPAASEAGRGVERSAVRPPLAENVRGTGKPAQSRLRDPRRPRRRGPLDDPDRPRIRLCIRGGRESRDDTDVIRRA